MRILFCSSLNLLRLCMKLRRQVGRWNSKRTFISSLDELIWQTFGSIYTRRGILSPVFFLLLCSVKFIIIFLVDDDTHFFFLSRIIKTNEKKKNDVKRTSLVVNWSILHVPRMYSERCRDLPNINQIYLYMYILVNISNFFVYYIFTDLILIYCGYAAHQKVCVNRL
jgi:hypothetical protein